MHKKFVAFFSVIIALCAVGPLSAKKRHSRRKRICTTTVHKKHIPSPSETASLSSAGIAAQRDDCKNEAGDQNAIPIKTHDAKIIAPTTTVSSAKSSVSTARRRGHGRKKKRIIVRRRKIRRSTGKALPVLKGYSPEQLEKIAKLRSIASFIWPIQQAKFYISSPFGARRNPNGKIGFHSGIDMAAPKGTPVVAAADGIVLAARPYKAYGNMIFLGHRKKLFTRYAHLDRILVKEGEIVRKGTVIGRVGNTGRVRHRKGHDGSHLHWETYIKNTRVNPRLFI